MDFAETAEHEMLRAAVRDVAAEFGHEYFAEKSRNGEKADELWKAVGELGFLGVHLPEEYGGGGGGMSELAIVSEEARRAGLPAAAHPRVARDLRRAASRTSAPTRRRSAGSSRWPRARRWCSRSPSPTRDRTVTTSPPPRRATATCTASAVRRRSSPASTKRRTWSSSPAPPPIPTPDAGACRCSSSTPTRPGSNARIIPVEIAAPEKQFTLFFDNVEVPADRLLGDEDEGLRQVFVGLNPERIMSATICTGIGRYALDRAAQYANEREVWGVPIGRHQGVAHPLAIAKIEVELARLMTAKAAWMHDHSDDRVAAGEAANMAKYAAAEAGLHASTPRSKRTAATAWRPSTASPTCGAWCACCASRR